jgi:hypothetical protein
MLPRPSALGRDDWNGLLGIVADALHIFPPLYVSSILGLPWTWLPPHAWYSEFKVLDVWRLDRALKYVLDVSVPALPGSVPPFGPRLISDVIWRPTLVLQRPDHRGSYTTFPREAWFFVNGILTNDAVAHLNAAYLADLFHRPITIVQNSTGGVLSDLAECALGKQWYRATESVRQAFPAVYDALKSEKERVVVIAHSQGTIIMSVVLSLLLESLRLSSGRTRPAARPRAGIEPVPPHDWPIRLEEFVPVTIDDLRKLEIYCLANCATTMRTVGTVPQAGRARRARQDEPGACVPWVESFGNEFDIVARLGMLAPNAAERGIHLSGPRYIRRGGWGHLLNEHYLHVIDEGQRTGHRRGGAGRDAPFELVNPDEPHEVTPRLFAYINGGTPAARA